MIHPTEKVSERVNRNYLFPIQEISFLEQCGTTFNPYTDRKPSNSVPPPHPLPKTHISLTTACGLAIGWSYSRTVKMSEEANRKSIAAYTMVYNFPLYTYPIPYTPHPQNFHVWNSCWQHAAHGCFMRQRSTIGNPSNSCVSCSVSDPFRPVFVRSRSYEIADHIVGEGTSIEPEIRLHFLCLPRPVQLTAFVSL